MCIEYWGPSTNLIKSVDPNKKIAHPTILVIESSNDSVNMVTEKFREAVYQTPIRVFSALTGVGILKQANDILRGSGTMSKAINTYFKTF